MSDAMDELEGDAEAPHRSGWRPVGATAPTPAPAGTGTPAPTPAPPFGDTQPEAGGLRRSQEPESGPGVFSPGDMCGPYRIVREYKRGGMAIVYEARDVRGKALAIKVLQPNQVLVGENRERFRVEIAALQQIVCPNVVRFYKAGIEEEQGEGGGVVWFAMEFLPGETLLDFIARRGGQMTTQDALYIAGQLANALISMHRFKIVHRDLKPANVSIDGRNQVKVVDFGVAKYGDFFTTMQNAFAPLTPAHMSPEQAAGVSDIDGRADIFNFGLIMYELMSGRPALTMPSTTVTRDERFAHVMMGEIAPLDVLECDPALASLIYKAMARDRNERFQSARELADAVSMLMVADRRETDRSVNTEERTRRQVRAARRNDTVPLQPDWLAEPERTRTVALRPREVAASPYDATVRPAPAGQPAAAVRYAQTVPMPAGQTAQLQRAAAVSEPRWMAKQSALRVAKTRSMVSGAQFRDYQKSTNRKIWMVVAVALSAVGGLVVGGGVVVAALWGRLAASEAPAAAAPATATAKPAPLMLPAPQLPAAAPRAEPTAVVLAPTASAPATAAPQLAKAAPRPRRAPTAWRKPKPKRSEYLPGGGRWLDDDKPSKKPKQGVYIPGGDGWLGPPEVGGLDEEKPKKPASSEMRDHGF